MSDNVYITEERLKNYLNTNQSERERMCLQILSLDSNYSEIKPRHPNGGKDHGRDIEALYKNEILCFCGVGFVNNACDSNEQKNEIKNKFDSDLQSAIKNAEKENIKLKGFIFFTNLELTISERDSLIEKAHENGLTHCEIYHRERLLIALNSPDGFAIRFNSLNIPLSPEEQSSFFSKWGNDIQSVISNGFQEQKKAIDRMIFLQEAQLPINYLHVGYKLKKEYLSEEIGHFRIVSEFLFVEPHDFEDNKYAMGLTLYRTDNPNRYRNEDSISQPGFKYGLSGCTTFRLVSDSENNEEKEFMVNSFSSIGYEKLNYLSMDYSNGDLVRFPPILKIQNFDKGHFIPIISENLCDKIETIEVFINGYVLFKIGSNNIKFRDINEYTLNDYPARLTKEEQKIKWKIIEDINGFMFQFNFTNNTPNRIIQY